MNSSVAGWLLCLTALCLWGSIGTLAKASAVQWSLFFKAYSTGVGASALVLAIAAALLFRQVIVALFLGVWVGAWIVSGDVLTGWFTCTGSWRCRRRPGGS